MCPHLQPTLPLSPSSPAQGLLQREKREEGRLGRGEGIKKEVIDARCHCKQNGKYNLAFSLCGDNGARNEGDTGMNKQPGLLSVRNALVRCGAQVREGRGGHEARELN